MTVFFIISVCLITIFAAWWDFKTYHAWLRSFLIFLSGLMLLGFFIKPKILSSNQSSGYALLTDGTDQTSFSSSRYDSVYSVQPRQTFFNQLRAESTRWLSSASLIEKTLPAGNAVEIFGYGTTETLSKNYRWIDQLAPPENGLILISAPHEAEVGKPFRLNFEMVSASEEDSILVIKDGINLRTAKPDSTGKIEIHDQLSSEGPVHYQIEWVREDTVVTENWNIRAVQPQRLSIGMLLYSPLFEMNYLAEILGERGHKISARTRIGQNRFRYDDLNSPDVEAENILSNPAAFDLLILDAREYQQLQLSERNLLQEAVGSGLDVLLTPPSPENPDEWRLVFDEITGQNIIFQELNRLEERLWSPDFVDPSLVDMNRIPLLNLDFQSIPENTSEILWYQEVPIALRTDVENGSVSTHLFFQSFNWLLGGHSQIYHRFWADYLSKLITLEESFLNIATTIPKKDRPVTITSTSQSSPIFIYSVSDGNTITVPFINKQNHPGVGHTVFWPTSSGWHFVEQGENRSWFYVYDLDWQFDSSYQAFRNTRQQIEAQNRSNDFPDSSSKKKIPDWIWLISFLGLQGLLWVERKVN